ncbi:MAG: lamin tail domain-containing protein [Proteobacteria bacterium]|jgi:uncharacterized protein|nr:lamin tail domain-containing protein [Pseudomonadota bacterium]
MFFLFMFLGCVEYQMHDQADQPLGDNTPVDEEPVERPEKTVDSDTGDTAVWDLDIPLLPEIGELVITELMIDPSSVSDGNGEWVELHNTSTATLDLFGCALGDMGVDGFVIEEVFPYSLVIEPGGFAVVCADHDNATNGGVECQGAFLYQSFGGGFALSNVADEVILISNDGKYLDTVSYGEGFSRTGASMGTQVNTNTSSNDNTDNWCKQADPLPGGDLGTPGRSNSCP